MFGHLQILLLLHSITMVNALGADECVATPPGIDVTIIEYPAKEERFASVTVKCGFILKRGNVVVKRDPEADMCKIGWGYPSNRSAVISTMLYEDAIYSDVNKKLCNGTIEIWTKKHASNREQLSLKINVHVVLLAFVCS